MPEVHIVRPLAISHVLASSVLSQRRPTLRTTFDTRESFSDSRAFPRALDTSSVLALILGDGHVA
jgi:hypothetical protein